MSTSETAEIDVARARRETPGCLQVLHLNNAGAALMPAPVLTAIHQHLDLEAAIGGYEAAAQAHAASEHVYDAAARLLNCQPTEIAVVENATRAWDMLFYSLPLGPGDRILTAQAEYASNYLAYLQVCRRTGARVEVIPSDEHGQVSTAALANLLDDRVKLIALTHVPTNGGLVNPAAEIGRLARQAGVPYLLDACQSVGQMPIDVQAIGCDFLSATGRKYLRGPRGTGLLYCRVDWIPRLEPVFLDLHAATWTGPDEYEIRPDARRFENWETNYATKIALGVAIDYALEWELDLAYARIVGLAERLRWGIAAASGARIHDLGRQQCGIVSFDLAAIPAKEVQRQLSARRMNVSVSPASYTLLDMSARGLSHVVRASVHYYNTEGEVDQFCAALREIATGQKAEASRLL
ncbi:MAG: aminotransferase class V-fold PLP-dependent enzyme [Pirellulaceae bacterium]|nr:aminotransferase class V-fold PLP-dependent enzyme [Pirellulaceae bacterium]